MLSRLWETAFGNIIVMKIWIYARSPVVNDINTGRNLWAASHHTKSPTGTINALDEYHDNVCVWKHPHCQQDQVSHRPLWQPSDADLLLVWPLFLLLSPRRRHGLFAGDSRLPNWLQLLRPSRLTWIAKREAVRLPSLLQFVDRLGRPGLRNAKLFGFPPGCSFLDREHDLRKILIRHKIHSTKNVWERNSNWLLASLIKMIRRWDGAACIILFTWPVMIVVFVEESPRHGLGKTAGDPHLCPHLCLLPSFPCSPFCMSSAVLLSSSL